MSETRHYGPGSDAGARRWAIANTLIQTCKLNGVEPLAYLTDVLQRIVSWQAAIIPGVGHSAHLIFTSDAAFAALAGFTAGR